jgi:hypothetical protein
MSLVSRRFLAAVLSAAAATAFASPAAAQRRNLGEGHPSSSGRKVRTGQPAPQPGALNSAEAVDALRGPLGQRVIERGGNADEYATLLAADESLWITDEGQLMFVDRAHLDVDEDGNPIPALPATPTGPPPAPESVLSNGLPVHHSKPGAPWTLYLDFDGEVVNSRSWRIFNRVTPPFSTDDDFSTFNPDEQAFISRLWGRTAEDWAPFDVDVTTERPALIGASVLWSIIARRPSDLGFQDNVAGVSLFTLGYVPFGTDTPTFTFWQSMAPGDHSTTADVVSHEGGHMFGLLHDGFALNGAFGEYYGGHGTGATSWGPLMGAPIDRNVTQWSRLEYPGGINFLSGQGNVPPQNDIPIIAGKVGFRADDVTDTIAGAPALNPPASAFITSASDVDVFALPIADEVRIGITPFRAGELTDGGNLDVAAEILDAAGTVVAGVDDLEQTTATLAADLPLTPHFLRVRASANPASYTTYGSLGAYTVTGTFTRTVKIAGFQEPLPAATVRRGRTLPVKFTLTDTVAAARVLLLADEHAADADALAETGCQAQAQGRQHCNLRVPASLVPGASYWIAAQYQGTDGQWVTLRASDPATLNPAPFVAE